MKAIVFDTYGPPEVLHTVEVPVPGVGPNQIRVRVAAATVNPHDLMVRAGDYDAYFSPDTPVPRRPGMDAAGVVDAVGSRADTRVQVGDSVVAIVDPFSASGGAYAEYVTVDADQVVAAPIGASAVEAATLPLNGLTATGALDSLNLAAGATLWVTGAAGGVGGFAVQLARTRGLHVIADAAAAEIGTLRRLGVHTIVDRDTTDPARPVLAARPRGVDAILDAALLQQQALPALVGTGTIAVLRNPGQRDTAELDLADTRIRVTHPVITDHIHHTGQLQHLSDLAGDHLLALRVSGTYPADQAADAHRRLGQGGLLGRLVLTF
ncbi:NADP-dependent oxidoreductase [Nocardia sp. CS682]|uniref:NADP-dependent oxidoreductase n=1 Tax=Nocardia sp. CS682 TaxID=1047172 RepID=UPI00107539D3|nr:NADP-dependent oxidoreductase [Nocardia sp. CS682]QBS38931.1 alcohol dehydrogenase [Nocardia sp. CS682]